MRKAFLPRGWTNAPRRVCLLIPLVLLILLPACGGGKLKDGANANYMDPNPREETEIAGVDFYMDVSQSMGTLAEDSLFNRIVYSAYGAAMEISRRSADDIHIYDAGGDPLPDAPLPELDRNFFSGSQSASAYHGDSDKILSTALSRVQPKRLSIIISDLDGQLKDYAGVSNLLINQVISAHQLASAVIGVEAQPRPFFLFAVGAGDSVSRFVTAFKEKPDVLAYAGKPPELQLDEIQKINYQVFASQNGILGIHYANIRPVENGVYYQPAPENPDLLPGQSLTPSGRFITRAEEQGSFSSLNAAYTADQTGTIEGSVNVSDVSDALPRQVMIYPRNGGSRADFRYLAFSPLIKDRSRGLAAKIKLEIPFDIIDGVKLSALDCKVSTSLYTSSKEEFVPYKGEAPLYASVAESAIAEQGKWRVDDAKNAIIFNIILPDAAALPTASGALNKLDVTIRFFASETSVPAWVKDWDARKQVENLHNLFDSINKHQSELNSGANAFTVYIQ
ncbi:MAG: hypothetical protein LBT44_09100 [Clostridiales bacterium]|nr:hypothetical protein [Clostridiales bacterium]